MIKDLTLCILATLAVAAFALPSAAQSITRADLFQRYQLDEDAKREFIKVVASPRQSRSHRARAWKGLAELSARVGDASGEAYAIQQLVRRYPNHPLAIAAMTKKGPAKKQKTAALNQPAITKEGRSGAQRSAIKNIGKDAFPLASLDYLDQAAQAIHKSKDTTKSKTLKGTTLADGYQ